MRLNLQAAHQHPSQGWQRRGFVMNELELQTIRADFPILSRQVHGQPLVYLDNAATTMKPKGVIDAVMHYYCAETANVHRGLHHLSMLASEKYEESRRKIGSFINAASEREIIFTKVV